MKIRVTPCEGMQVEILHEPMAAVRLNYHARFTAKEGSQEWLYVHWKDDMRDLFDQLDYRNHEIGIPYHEPLSVSGTFLLSVNPDGKDLDNLIKAFFDAMNPVRKKDFSGLRTFLWVDDKQIRRFGGWAAIPSGEPKTVVTVTPLWGRADPMISFIDGFPIDKGGGAYLVNTKLGYPFHCQLLGGVDKPSGFCRLWVVDTQQGVSTVVSRPEQVVFVRELGKLPRVGAKLVAALMSAPWCNILEGLQTGNAQFWAAEGVSIKWADRTIGQLRELCQDPEKRMISLAEKFDQAVFEQVAAKVSQQVGLTWSLVRSSLAHEDLDWRADFDAVVEDATKVIEVKHAVHRKKPSAARSRKRAGA